MKRTNPFELLESRLLMSITHTPTFEVPVKITPIVVPLVPTVTPKVVALTAPGSLKAERIGTSELFLTWKGDNSATSGYTIQRSSNGSTGWNNIGTTTVTGRDFLVTGLTNFTRYFYRVVAAGSGGAVAFSSVVSTPPKRL